MEHKKLFTVLKIVFAVISILFLMLAGYTSRQYLMCTEKVSATALYGNKINGVFIERLGEEVAYVYAYDGINYSKKDITSFEKVKKINESGQTYVWICPANPEISAFDRKEDIIIFSLANMTLSLILTIGFTFKTK